MFKVSLLKQILLEEGLKTAKAKSLSDMTDAELARRERRLSQNLRDVRKELKGVSDAKEKKELLAERKDLEARLEKVDAELESREKGGKKAGQGLELLENLDDPKALHRAWPNVTYKGVPLLGSRGYPFQDKADDQVTYEDWQEVYMGYDPVKDVFVVGYDVWLPEDDYDEWEEEDEWGALPGGGYRAAKEAGHRKKADMEAQAIVLKFDGRNTRILDTIYGPGGFYHAGHRAVKRKFPKIIDLRLD